MRFLLRRLLIPVLVLALLFFGGNALIQGIAEDRIAQAAQTSFDLNEEPIVELEGFPMLVRVFSGALPGMSFRAGNVDIEGLRFREVVVRMRDIKAQGGLLRSAELEVSIGRAEVRGEATDAAVSAFLEEQGERATIEFHDNRRATVRTTGNFGGAQRRIVAQGKVELLEAKQQLRFTPEQLTVDGDPPPAAFRDAARRRSTITVAIPRLPGGFRVTILQTAEGTVAFAALLENFEFPIPQDEPPE
ncbi:MAG TPA: DUF2993 domain-containing protein [Actinomycetota bacterium]